MKLLLWIVQLKTEENEFLDAPLKVTWLVHEGGLAWAVQMKIC